MCLAKEWHQPLVFSELLKRFSFTTVKSNNYGLISSQKKTIYMNLDELLSRKVHKTHNLVSSEDLGYIENLTSNSLL